jgi:cap2 methyltransferase
MTLADNIAKQVIAKLSAGPESAAKSKQVASVDTSNEGLHMWFTVHDFERLPKLGYTSSQENNNFNHRKNLHRGQRKLFLSEIQFLTAEVQSLSQSVFCVYAGASPGQAPSPLPRILEMFPQTKWLLCDPAFTPRHFKEFRKYIVKKQVALLDEIFTVDTARAINTFMQTATEDASAPQTRVQQLMEALQVRKDALTLFVSDLRSRTDEESILNDMLLQYNCFVALPCANAGMFKFRPPYPDHVTNISHELLQDGQKLRYFDGQIYWPIFGPVQTTESRLHVKRSSAQKEALYDIKTYEQIMSHFNFHERPAYDMKAEKKVREDYLQKFDKEHEPFFDF